MKRRTKKVYWALKAQHGIITDISGRPILFPNKHDARGWYNGNDDTDFIPVVPVYITPLPKSPKKKGKL